MITKEQFPVEFNMTTLHMIFKGGKGKKEILSDNRFIHSKTWMPRLAEALVVEEGMKKPLVENSTIYQILIKGYSMALCSSYKIQSGASAF